MDLVKPEFGLIIWSTIAFLLLFVLLAKYAWKPILAAVTEREESIRQALSSADKARMEMAAMTATNEQILKETYLERDNILKKAKDVQDSIVADAKDKARAEAEKLIIAARSAINTEKQAAITELKNQVAALSIEIAERIIREHLSAEEKQKALANNLVKELSLN